MEWMLMPLRRYADFSGRSRRKEYWMFFLGYLVVGAVLGLLAALTGGLADDAGGASTLLVVVGALVILLLVVPSLAVQVRRFHDQDKSGWFVLLGFIPYVGAVVVIVFMCLPGTVGPNRFGPDPKSGHLGDVFA